MNILLGPRGLGRGVSHDLPLEGLAEVRSEIRLLRTLVLDMLLAQSRGEPIELDSAELKTLLGLSGDASEEDIVQRILWERAPLVDQLPCPECGGMVNQREGMEDVDCHWCGATVAFAPVAPNTEPG